MGAVGEGVPVAPVGRVPDFPQAIGANRRVRERHRRNRAREPALKNEESRGDFQLGFQDLDGIQGAKGGQFARETAEERLKRTDGSLDLQGGTLRGVGNLSRKSQFNGQSVDEGPEAHTLDRAVKRHLETMAAFADEGNG
jgi:hypothetical protein